MAALQENSQTEDGEQNVVTAFVRFLVTFVSDSQKSYWNGVYGEALFGHWQTQMVRHHPSNTPRCKPKSYLQVASNIGYGFPAIATSLNRICGAASTGEMKTATPQIMDITPANR